MRDTGVDAQWLAVAIGAVPALVVATSFAGIDASIGLAGSLLVVGGRMPRSDFAAMVGWLVGGSLAGAGVGYAAGSVLALPLSTTATVALGLALGGGVGGVARSVAADEEDRSNSVTVAMDAEETPTPEPSDLFDGHPDPVLYVADRGHGPVVLAANRAFADAFDVPAEVVSGTPLDEVLLATDDADDVVEAATGADQADAVYRCETADGERPFRLRTVGTGSDGYVLYTPVETEG